MAVRHVREYRVVTDEGEELTTELGDNPVTCQVPYNAIVKLVELYQDGRMSNGDASALRQGNGTYKLDDDETIRAISAACVLEDRMLAAQGVCLQKGSHGHVSEDKLKVHDGRGFQEEIQKNGIFHVQV